VLSQAKKRNATPVQVQDASVAFLKELCADPNRKRDFERRAALIEILWDKPAHRDVMSAAMAVIPALLDSFTSPTRAQPAEPHVPAVEGKTWVMILYLGDYLRETLLVSFAVPRLSAEIRLLCDGLKTLLDALATAQTSDVRTLRYELHNNWEYKELRGTKEERRKALDERKELSAAQRTEKEEQLKALVERFSTEPEPDEWKPVRAWYKYLSDMVVVAQQAAVDGCKALSWVAHGGEPGMNLAQQADLQGFSLACDGTDVAWLEAMERAVKSLIAAAVEAGPAGNGSASGPNRPSDAGIAGDPELPNVAHGDDYRSLRWFGTVYNFTANQAPVVKLLFEHWTRGTPDISGETLLNAVDPASPPERLNLVFRGNAAWGSIIVRGATKGAYRLKAPQGHPDECAKIIT